MDPDPAIFVIQNKKYFFSAFYFLELQLHHFSKIKVIKKSQNSRNQGFSYYFCFIIGKDPDTNTDPYLWLTDPDPKGPKTYLRIRIRKTAGMCSLFLSSDIYNKLDKARMQFALTNK